MILVLGMREVNASAAMNLRSDELGAGAVSLGRRLAHTYMP
jgi:hypothetical protein